MCVCAQSCPTQCNTMGCSLPRSSVRGILQIRRQEQWGRLPLPPPGDRPNPGIKPGPGLFHLLHWQAGSSPLVPPGKPCVLYVTSVMSDSTAPGTVAFQAPLCIIHLQARILEWVAIFSSRGSSQPRDWTCIFHVSCIGRQVLYHWHTWVYSNKNF